MLNRGNSAASEFEAAMKNFAEQSIITCPYTINPIKNSEQVIGDISFEEAWALEINKAKHVHEYLDSITFSMIIPGTERKTSYGQAFNRISIQPAWLDGRLAIVKEEVHIFENEHRIVFYGRPVNLEEAKKHMGRYFDNQLIRANIPLFHVEHGLQGTAENPINTWRMVFVDQKISPEKIAAVKSIIAGLDWNGLYAKADSLVALNLDRPSFSMTVKS